MSVASELSNPVEFPAHKRWTRNECAALEQAGLLDSHQYELIEGDLLTKLGKMNPHMRAVFLLAAWLRSTIGDAFVVTEPAIDVRPEGSPTSEPEPDVIVLDQPFLELTQGATRPQPKNIRFLAEVSASTLAFDLTVKARLYARSGIPEYWVLDLQNRRLIVHRQPNGDVYLSVAAYGENESVSPLAAPTQTKLVADLF